MCRKLLGEVLPVFIFAIGILNSTAAPGDVDLSFNPGSRVNDNVYALAAQPDGKLIVGGLFTSPGTLLARLNSDGSMDTNFNVGTGANGIIYSIALQPDGRILIGGAFTRFNGTNRNRIARLNANGSLDMTFDPGLGADDRIRAVALQANGRVLIGGDFFEVNQTPRLRIARLNANGSVDTTFNPGSGADEEVFAIAVQPDGRIVIGGYFLNVNDISRGFIARLNANGSIDDNFDPGSGCDLDVDSIALQPDGKIVIGGGFGFINGIARDRIARLNFDGSVDESFNPGFGVDFHVGAVALQADGKVIVGGNFGSVNGVPRSNIARLNGNGSVDASFDPGNGTDAIVNAVAIQPGGKVAIGGGFRLVNGATRNYLARLNANGSVEAGFNPSTGADYPVLSVASAPEGKVLIGGYFTVINNVSRNHVARLNADGSLDAGFHPGTGANNRVVSVVALPDGKALIGGLFTLFNGTNCGRIARLNADGNLDTSFGGGVGANADVLAVAAQSDGKVVIGGEFNTVHGTNMSHVARLNTDGSLDLDFRPGSGADLAVRSVAVQPDGKVLIAGDFVTVDGTNRNRITRLNSNGTVDATFNPGTGANATVESLALQPDGKVLIGGQFTSINGTNRSRIARLNADGGLDTSFNPSSGPDGFVLSVAVHPDGRILIGGDFFSVNGASRPRVARLNSNGSLDATFDPGTGANDTVNSVAWQADGNALVGGFFNTVDGIGRSSVARLEGDRPPPAINISRASAGVILSWPSALAGFTLQSNTNVAGANGWTSVSTVPVLVNGQWVVTNSTDSIPPLFFRLKSP